MTRPDIAVGQVSRFSVDPRPLIGMLLKVFLFLFYLEPFGMIYSLDQISLINAWDSTFLIMRDVPTLENQQLACHSSLMEVQFPGKAEFKNP
jgi:hypothetical protein